MHSFESRATETRGHGGLESYGHRVVVTPWLVAACIALSGALLRATTVAPADFAEMVNGSQAIVHGAVVEVRAQATAGRSTIETLVTVAVVDVLKGQAVSTVVFRVPGGRMGRYRRVMVGAPEFAEGEEVVLFLRGRAPALPLPFGLNQGVYRVARASGRALVTPLVADGAGRVVRGDPARRPLALEAFAEQVRAVTGRER